MRVSRNLFAFTRVAGVVGIGERFGDDRADGEREGALFAILDLLAGGEFDEAAFVGIVAEQRRVEIVEDDAGSGAMLGEGPSNRPNSESFLGSER